MLDNSNFYYGLGFLCGFVAVAIAGLIISIVRKKKNKENTQPYYDERQNIARGKSYQSGFFTMVGYYLVYAILDVFGITWCENFVGVILGILIGVGVFAVIAINNDAYFALNSKKKQLIGLFVFIIICQIAGSIGNIINNEFIINNKLSLNSINLFVAVLFIIILIAIFVHDRHLKQEELVETE